VTARKADADPGAGQGAGMAGARPRAAPGRWRAWHTFVAALCVAFAAFAVALAVALLLWLRQGALHDGQASFLLALVRNGTYPVVFVALGALLWHYVRSYRGDYARR
jgi:hypothetical protein